MTQATIHLSGANLGQSSAGLVHGEMSLRIDDMHFPDPRWSDFIVVVLNWWCSALWRLLRGERGPIEVRFMEGPFLVELGPLKAGSVCLVLVEAGLQRRTIRRVVVECRPLIESALSAADRTLMECQNRNWWSPDADELKEARNRLHKELSVR